MKYKDCIDFLYHSLPMYQRVGAAAYKPDLGTTLSLLSAMGNPQERFPVVHVAGTNGKGSVSHALASILQEAGYKVGLYTSPHLKSFRERIRINGKAISPYSVTRFVDHHLALFKELKPSFFEMTVAMAFDHFARKKVDIAVVEVGMGGRLDSTNVVHPVLSVITNISLDHTQFLGHTLAEIAKEKAGIIKEGVPVVIGETHPETAPVFEAVAREKHAPLVFADQVYKVSDAQCVRLRRRASLVFDLYKNGDLYMGHLISPFAGAYQQKNFQTVAAAYDQLFSDVEMPLYTFKHGIRKMERTGLQGRWQQLQARPLAIADTGHNEAGIRYVMEQLQALPHRKLHVVLGMVSDKDVDAILPLFPADAVYYFTNAQIPRALKAELLQEKAAAFGLKGRSYVSVKSAYKAAIRNAKADDVVFVGGSTFVVAEVV